jgi:hypothetical protein
MLNNEDGPPPDLPSRAFMGEQEEDLFFWLGVRMPAAHALLLCFMDVSSGSQSTHELRWTDRKLAFVEQLLPRTTMRPRSYE